LAEQLGANIQVIHEAHRAVAIMNYAMVHGFTKILIGKSKKPKWKQIIFGSLAIELIKASRFFDLYLIGDNTGEDIPVKKTKVSKQWRSYLGASFIVAICTILGFPFKQLLLRENIVMIYLVGIVIIASSSERRVAAFAAILSVVCYNYFFTRPTLSLDVFHFQDLITLGVLLFASIMISSQTSLLHLQKNSALRREKYTSELYQLSRKLIATKGKNKIAKVVVRHINEIFECSTTVWLPDEFNHLQLASHPDVKPDIKEDSVANWAFSHNQSAGIGTNTMPSARGYYLPLSNGKKVWGVLGVIPKIHERSFSSEELMMLEALGIQLVSALERA
jgi:two-component system, OmpR family, sensor histidine kinase KdpD